MALGKIEKKPKIYLSINDGKVVKSDTREQYSYIEGNLTAIYIKTSTFGREEVNRWFIEMQDGDELYSICLPYSSGVFKSIVLALASDETLEYYTPVRIEPYKGKNGYTKVVVYSNGVKLDWAGELPPKKSLTIDGEVVTDDRDQMRVITSFVDSIKKRIVKPTSEEIRQSITRKMEQLSVKSKIRPADNK